MINKILTGLITFSIPFYLLRFKLFIPTTFFEIFIIFIFIYILISNQEKLLEVIRNLDKYTLVGVGLFLLGSIIGVYFSINRTAALGELKGFVVIPILAGLCTLVVGKRNEMYAKWGLYISSFLIGIESVGEYLFHIATIDGRVIGIYRLDAGASPNYISLYLTPIAVLLLHDLFRNKVNYKKIFGPVILLSLVFSIVFSGSRAGIGVLLMTFLYEVYIYTSKVYKRSFVNIATTILGLVLISGIIFISLPHFKGNSNYSRVSSSNNIRYTIWKTTVLEIIPKHWLFGIGLGNYQEVFSKDTLHRVNFDKFITPMAVTPHNIFLSTWLGTGLIGLVGLLTVLYGFFKRNSIVSSWSISLVSIIILGLVDTPVFKNDLGSYFWILILAGGYWSSQSGLRK